MRVRTPLPGHPRAFGPKTRSASFGGGGQEVAVTGTSVVCAACSDLGWDLSGRCKVSDPITHALLTDGNGHCCWLLRVVVAYLPRLGRRESICTSQDISERAAECCFVLRYLRPSTPNCVLCSPMAMASSCMLLAPSRPFWQGSGIVNRSVRRRPCVGELLKAFLWLLGRSQRSWPIRSCVRCHRSFRLPGQVGLHADSGTRCFCSVSCPIAIPMRSGLCAWERSGREKSDF